MAKITIKPKITIKSALFRYSTILTTKNPHTSHIVFLNAIHTHTKSVLWSVALSLKDYPAAGLLSISVKSWTEFSESYFKAYTKPF